MTTPSSAPRPIVLQTDRAWPDDAVEREVVEGAGFVLVAGPADAAPEAVITGLVSEHQPAAILTCWAPVSAAAISASAGLRVVTRLGVGLDTIDVATATARGVLVTNVPDYCVPEVSDHAVGMVLAWTRGLVVADRAVRAGRWDPAGARLRRLESLACGIVGYGRIGQATARKLAAFGCRVVATSRRAAEPGGASPDDGGASGAVPLVPLDELLAASDVVILHVPLTSETAGMIGAAQLARMRPGGLLVNVGRGGLVDTTALTAALASGHLSGAALDVLDTEPHVPPALLEQTGAVITPHIAFSSDVSLAQLRRSAAEDVVRVLRGQPPRYPCNPVSCSAGLPVLIDPDPD